MKYFTDQEYRLVLSALGRERKVCEMVEKDCGEEHKLIVLMNGIDRKIKNVQYDKAKQRNILLEAQDELKEERHIAEDIFNELYNNCKCDLDRKILHLCSMVMQTHAALEDDVRD